MMRNRLPAVLLLPVLVAGCGDREDEARGVDHDETLLSVSATGRAEAKPDRAEFTAGIETFGSDAGAASKANAARIAEIVAALGKVGIGKDDIQTQTLALGRVDWGEHKGQYQAQNRVRVTVRDIARADAAVAAVTGAGANLMGGPDLAMSDPEAAANDAYAQAYKAARRRAEAYAKVAGMTVSRVLYIRDAGGSQGNRYLPAAQPLAMAEQAGTIRTQSAVPVAAPPPPPAAPGGTVMAGQTASEVSIQVDFALRPT